MYPSFLQLYDEGPTNIDYLLVRRCNCTTAGLGYWKVGLKWPYNTGICDSTIKLKDVDGLND
jgi:hypothetical protein